ncbi:MAG: hypothetical protein RMK35_00765 [Aquificaceae bacterium]|nr:hypothetical protein [Aquificaceae bacterium]
MNRLLTAVVSLIGLSAVALAQETSLRQYPYLYKSPRAMGMGGAYVAVGGKTDSVFYNPAGLSKMPVKNFEVNLINLSAGIGKNVLDFAQDLQDAFDVGDRNRDGDETDDQLREVNRILKKYRGEPMHLELSNWSSIGRNQGNWAFTLGGVARARMDAVPHQGFGSNGFLEVDADITGGGVFGLSFKVAGGLFLGGSVKALRREAIKHSFTAAEIVENQDNLEDYITEELRKSGNAVSGDVGIIYAFAQKSFLRPAIGASVMNIGDLDFKKAGKIPMTVNIGFSVNPKIPVFHSLILAADYIDLTQQYKEDKDKGKRIRLGGELQLINRWWLQLALRAGIYQGYPTYGAEIGSMLFNLSYVSYAEEVGAYAGQKKDRRHLITLNIGW